MKNVPGILEKLKFPRNWWMHNRSSKIQNKLLGKCFWHFWTPPNPKLKYSSKVRLRMSKNKLEQCDQQNYVEIQGIPAPRLKSEISALRIKLSRF